MMVLLSDAYQYVGGMLSGSSWAQRTALSFKPFSTLSPNKTLGGYMFAIAASTLSSQVGFPNNSSATRSITGTFFVSRWQQRGR